MTTPDPPAAGGSLPAAAATTPGLSGAGARVPTAPTLPAPDPVSLTQAIAKLANELFVAAPAPASVGAPSPAAAVTPSVPHSPPSPPAAAAETAPAPVGAGAGAPGAGDAVAPAGVAAPAPVAGATAPFSAPLDFTAIAMPADPYAPPSGFDVSALPSLALVDPRTPLPEIPAMPDESTVPAPAVPPAPAPPLALTLDAFEIAPADDPVVRSLGAPTFDPNLIKREFPILQEPIRGKRLVWLDNAATTQKPQTVIDRLSYFYEHENSNVHRAAHTLAARATDAYESARESVRRFIKAPSKNEIVFVRGTTEGINLVAQSWGRRNVGPGDEIVLTWLEHHANIVPWQQLASEKGARLRVAPVDDRGQVILEEYEKLLGPRTRIVAFTQVSNALGTITPAAEMIEMAHRHGALVALDGAQAVSHMPVDVQALGCDFFVFSGHKVFAPTGIGVVWGRSDLLNTMPPWQGGGNMIQDVTFERTLYQGAPARFEAGTGNIADAVGLGAALDWLSRVGVERVERYEHELLVYATERLATVPGLTMIGTAPAKAGVLSFVLDGQKTEEVGGMLDQEGIAVRSGHHCAQPILRRFGLEATVRASLAPYNTREDIDALVAALQRIQAGQPRKR
jgi:cysteine desulfurase/selenocysteine lyase